MNKPQHSLSPERNNGTGSVSSSIGSSIELARIVDPERNEDAAPRLADRISPDLSSMDIKNISLRELLEYCLKNKNQEAWDEFDRRTRRTIRGVVAKRLRFYRVKVTKELVEEVTQDTFVKLVKYECRALRKDWPDESSIFKFIKAVGQSAVVDWLRKNKVLKDTDELDDHQEFCSKPTPDTAEKAILHLEIDRCLQALESHPNFKRDRAIFWLFYRYGCRDSEIAELVKLPVKSVQNILQKYVRVVRRELGGDKSKGAPEE